MAILQIIPCNIEMYAKYEVDAIDDEDGSVSKVNLNAPVVGFALCDDGGVYPMVFREDNTNVECAQTSNFKFEVRGHSNYYMTRMTSALLGIQDRIRDLSFK